MTYGQASKHKVFLSYYHQDDEPYRDAFEQKFGGLFIAKSVHPGDIDSDLGDEYIKRLIQEGYISDSSIVLVLVGAKTLCRKHVDWETSAGLSKKVGGYSGLLGVLLPSVRRSANGNYDLAAVPARLADNVKTRYAKMYDWTALTASASAVRQALETAFEDRMGKKHLIDNSRIQMRSNTCS